MLDNKLMTLTIVYFYTTGSSYNSKCLTYNLIGDLIATQVKNLITSLTLHTRIAHSLPTTQKLKSAQQKRDEQKRKNNY